MSSIKSRCGKAIFCFVAFLFLHCAAMTEMRQAEIAKGPEFAPFQGHKKLIAVLPFVNLTDNGGEKLGERVADMLVTQLINSGRFIILERQEIDRILSEQGLGQSGAITEETAVEAGQLLGVKAFVFGSITEFSQKSGAEDIGSEKKKWSFKLQATVAKANLEYRLINTTTGKILYANNARQTEFRPGFGIKTEKYDFSDLFQIDQTLIGTALRGTVNKAAQNIANQNYKIPWNGKVIKVTDEIVYFTPGRNAGVKLNEIFNVPATQDGDIELFDDGDPDTEQAAQGIKATIKVIAFLGEKVSKAITVDGADVETGDQVVENHIGNP